MNPGPFPSRNRFFGGFNLAGHLRIVEQEKSSFFSTSSTIIKTTSAVTSPGLGNDLHLGGYADNSCKEGT